MAKPFYHGGQAIIEGVMMRGRENIAIAVRRPDGKLAVETQPLASLYKSRLRQTPFVRGIIILIEALVLGTQALFRSAQIASAEEEEKISSGLLWGAVALGIGFAVALFFLAPLLLTRYFIDPYITSALVSNLIEGTLRIVIFVVYLKLIGLMPDIKTTFAYHGAEHKVVNAYEAGIPLDVENVKSYSTAHARCGTSFLLAVLVIAIIVFALLGRPPMWISILSRIILIPVIAALGYEAVRLGTTHINNILVRAFLAPGLALQGLTTREPDDEQMEAAISALQKVIEVDDSKQNQPPESEET